MNPSRIVVPASITWGTAVDAVEDYVDSRDFDPRKISLFDAERLERVVRAIRRGYAEEKVKAKT